MVRRVGMADSAAPHTGPSGGQAPALHFSTSPSLWIPAFAGWSCGLVQRIAMVDSATPHTGPSGGQAPALHFSTSPSLWIPAFAGRSCGLVRRVGMADSAAPHTGPSGGQAPALHFSTSPSLWIPAPYRGTGQALRWNDEMSGESLSRIGVREVLPCRYEAGPGLESIRSWIRV